MARTPEFRIAVLASGGGTTFEAVHAAIVTGLPQDTEIAYVACNNGPKNPDAGVWEKARRLGVDIHHISNLTQESCTLPMFDDSPVSGTISYEASSRLVELGEEYDIDTYVALGWMRRLIGPVLERYQIPNTHPGPLPATAGEHGTGVQEQVMRLGLDYSGPTFHWMDNRTDINGLPQYDTGAQIGHEPVEVTDEMKREWDEHATVGLLKAEVMRVEKLWVPKWIHQAQEQL